jgi:LmbE family N-acetylglucosaminyl deacetylase
VSSEQIIEAQNAIIFSPHPDDATLGCGGVISRRLREGKETHIVYMTDGRNSHLLTSGIKDNPTPLQLKGLRKDEAQNAQQILGNKTESLHFFDIEDGILLLNKKTALKKTRELLNAVRPSLVLVPYRFDGHPDHTATYDVVVKAVETGERQIACYQYFIWSLPFIKGTTLSSTEITRVDIGTELETKRTAVLCFKTQITHYSQNQSEPILQDDFLNLFDSRWEYYLDIRKKIDGKYSSALYIGRITIAAYQNLIDLRLIKRAHA